MRIFEQARLELIKLIDETRGLDPLDSKTFSTLVQASYEALEFDPVQQQRFDVYCRLSDDSPDMRLLVGTWMLRQALHIQSGRDVGADSAGEHRTWGSAGGKTSVKGDNVSGNECKARKRS
ncbi:MAG: hypothetical protein ACLP5H_24600 [Desulfomonilaceae bacterium]